MPNLEIPKGFATKLGTIGAAILAVVAVLQPFIADAASEDSNAKFFAALATLMAVATVLGRMMQAASALRDTPATDLVDWEHPDVEEPLTGDNQATSFAPSDTELAQQYPEDPAGMTPSGSGKSGEPAT